MTPFEGRTHATLGAPPSLNSRAVSSPHISLVEPQTDPFEPQVPDDEATAHPRAEASIVPLDASPLPPGIGPLPPNAGAHAIVPAALLAQPLPRVRAIVHGSHPHAIVEDDRGTHLVGIGDRVGTGRVVAITSTSIALDDGRRLTLPDAGALP